ncbi:DNA primase [Tepidimicrobium xylanilyticum]|uniref:DNA primase n=1 Tax=Tepidimicrobium xylanilyticum TaxID=1123352 RepID=A0A1H2T0P4_9FIRM|nr:DNA primase [Tepidimicrobium xylanilyticum]SDW37357.1 DNA primase [Tepidimicrobium xylanilyticum]
MSYNIDEELIERIHDTVDLIDVVSKYIQLKKTGSNYVGLCPFHNEKTPSFTISESKQLFHCFGCGEGGDVISFIMKIENLSFVEAVRFIAEQEGIPIMEKNPIDHKLKLQKDLLYEINREAAKFYYLNLGQNREALEYLGRRNLNKDIIKRFGLGYAPDKWDSLKNYLIKKGYEEEDIEKAGLIGKRKDNTGYYDKFRNRIMFPIIDGKGRVIGFGGRVLDQTMPKYLNSKDTLIFIKGNNLYGLNLIKRNFNLNKIILVEGYMDVISLYRNGIDYAVASLGTAFTSNQAKLLKRLNKEIYICYDSDNAGINATIKALNILDKEGLNPKVILLPKGHDPDDFINKMGLKEFEKLIDNAFNPIDYKILILRKKYNVNDIDGKIKFVKEVSVILRNINSPVEREIYIDKIAKEMEISEDAIKKEVLGNNYKNESSFSKDKYIIGRNRYNKSKIAPIKAVLEPAHLTAEKMLIRLMLESRSYYNIIKGYLNEEDFLNYESNILAKIIFDEYEKKVDLMKIANDFILVKLKQEKDLDYDLIYEIMDLNVGVLPENKNTLIKDLIKRIKISKLEMERKKILNEIKEIESKNVKDEGDVERFKLLCLELTKLDKELQSHT